MHERGSAELRTLARSINNMSASIDEREQKLREIADSRKRFADSMAHEMKTPLTSILGFADILRIKSAVSDSQRRDYATTIVEEAKRLRGLSAKPLQLASTNSTQLDLTDVPAGQLFADIAHTMAPILERRGIRLELLHKDAVLRVDRELFLSLLYNLIDNAAKASPEGGTVWLVQSALDGHIVLSVIDQGIGMKPDTVRRATEAFYMEDKARSRKAGGAGLGLALCDDICRRHGARLEIPLRLPQGHDDSDPHGRRAARFGRPARKGGKAAARGSRSRPRAAERTAEAAREPAARPAAAFSLRRGSRRRGALPAASPAPYAGLQERAGNHRNRGAGKPAVPRKPRRPPAAAVGRDRARARRLLHRAVSLRRRGCTWRARQMSIFGPASHRSAQRPRRRTSPSATACKSTTI